jgi:type VI secretion system protein ImpJ
MRRKAASIAATQTGEFSDRATIAALLGRLPPLEVLLKTRMTHPFELYQAYVDVLAGVLTLEYFRDFFEPVGYDHDDPAPGFFEHLEKISKQVADIELAFESMPFVEVEDGAFMLDLPANADTSELVVAVIPRDGQDPRAAVGWIGSALVGSLDAFDKLRRQRLLGAARRSMGGKERIEKRLPVRGNILVLSNETYDFEGDSYSAVEEGKKLCIRGRAGDGPAAIYLYLQQNAGGAPRGASDSR